MSSVLTVILLSVVIVGLAVFGLCFNIIFRKNGRFPDGEVGHSKELRKRGIVCMREEDERIWGRSQHIKITSGNQSAAKGKQGGKVKLQPDGECGACNADCAFKNLIDR